MENEKTLLALMIAGALSGCGGGGSGSSTANKPIEPTKTVTVIDGYLFNAVLFDDLDKNGSWSDKEPLLAITDKTGQAVIKANGLSQLGAMSVVSGSDLSQKLAQHNPEWASLNTYDMDFPQEIIGQEFTLIGPTSSNVISPITHLAQLSSTSSDISFEQAYQQILESLQELEADISDDFIAAKQVKLHKFSQLITQALTYGDFEQHFEIYLTNAVTAVMQMSDEQIKLPSFLPKLSNIEQGGSIDNHKLRINGLLLSQLKKDVNDLNLQAGDTGISHEFKLSDASNNLFYDVDKADLSYSLSFLPADGAQTSLSLSDQLTLTLGEDMDSLNVNASELLKGGQWTIYINATDTDSEGNAGSTKSVPLTFSIRTDNELPAINLAAEALFTLDVASWHLVEGEAFEAEFDYSNLFHDAEADEITYSWETSASAVGLDFTEKEGKLFLSGTPFASQKGHEDQHTITLYASDKYHDEKSSVTFRLNHIKPPFEEAAVGLEGPTWYYLLEDEDNAGQTRVYCHAIQFSGGGVYQTLSGSESYENCSSAASNMMNVGSYSFDADGTLNYKVFYYSYSVPRSYAQRADYGQAVSVRLSQKNKKNLTMFYSSALEAEKRLQIEADTTLDFTLRNENDVYYGVKADLTISQPNTFLLTLYKASDRNQLLTCDDMNWMKSISLQTASLWGGWASCKDTVDGKAVAPFFEDEISNGYAAIGQSMGTDSEKMMFSVK